MIEKKIAGLVELLTPLNGNQIIIARSNYHNIDFSQDLAVVDTLNINPVGRTSYYDGDNEIYNHIVRVNADITIDFYGANALDYSTIFIAMLDSELCFKYCQANEIEVFYNKTLKNLKQLVGIEHYNRYQVEMTAKYNLTYNENVLRIDEAVLDKIIVDK